MLFYLILGSASADDTVVPAPPSSLASFLPTKPQFTNISSSALQEFNLTGSYLSTMETGDDPSGFYNLSSRGDFMPLSVGDGVKGSLYLCVGLYNYSDGGKLLWLYTNVNNMDPLEDGGPEFEEIFQFKKYGYQAVPIRTNYQIQHDLKEGYFGPVRNTNPQAPLSVYALNVSTLFTKSSSNIEEDALADCALSGQTVTLVFQAWGAWLVTTLLLATLML